MSDVTSFTNVNESGADADPAAEGGWGAESGDTALIASICSDKTSATVLSSDSTGSLKYYGC